MFRAGSVAAGDRVRAIVPWTIRFPTMANHTATHLQAAPARCSTSRRRVGGAPDRLRLTSPGGQLTPEEREAIEQRVNRAIFANVPVRTFEATLDEARRLGAMALFGEKYGDVVRVVDVAGTSTELCGGTHVRSTAEVGAFAILGEGSVGGGTRRIEAVTSGEAWASLRARATEVDALRAELEEARRELKRKPQAAETTADPDAVVTAVDGVNVVVQAVDGFEGDALLDLSDRLKQRHAPAAVVLGSTGDGKASLVANFDGRWRASARGRRDPRRGAPRRRRRRRRSTMARAGGRRRKLPEALAEAERLIARPCEGAGADYGAARTGVAVSDATGRSRGRRDERAGERGGARPRGGSWRSTRRTSSSSGSH